MEPPNYVLIRQPRWRKTRSRPLTDRERGIDVVCRNGLFALPMEANAADSFVLALNKLALCLYNNVADMKMAKRSCEI